MFIMAWPGTGRLIRLGVTTRQCQPLSTAACQWQPGRADSDSESVNDLPVMPVIITVMLHCSYK